MDFVVAVFSEDVESMTGEIENGDLAVRDVADLLQPQYAIITGEFVFYSFELTFFLFFFLPPRFTRNAAENLQDLSCTRSYIFFLHFFSTFPRLSSSVS